ncbi:uncharacterized protein LOC124358021 [Homalodisca vitripennis]|uniref:uncharacterized protein LOC124358021 n=1 Tax=Homalodisca vitripennis TaxID=197043 RepID=UPI001EEB2B3A|nr:uncharacterized protein LOC124358021 [Homalodisca vitripennis]
MAELNDSADVFANSSVETIKENFDYTDFVAEARKPPCLPFMDDSRFDDFRGQVFTSSPISPQNQILPDADNISFIANQFVSEACNVPVILYCPFCCFTCHFEFIFKDHIKNSHPSEIMNIIRSNSFYIEFHACPFCHAKFYVKDLLPKHVLSKHEDSVIFTGLGRNNYAQCRFCSFKLLRKHIKRLVMHVEKKHVSEFENFLKSQNTSVALSSKDMKFFCEDIEMQCASNVGKKLEKMTAEEKVKRIKSILKPSKVNSQCDTPQNQSINSLTLNNGSYEAIRIQNSARRKLRFDIPESMDEDKENNLIPNQPIKVKKNKVKWFSLFKKEKRQLYQSSSPVFKPNMTPPKNPCEKTTSFFTKFHLEHDGVSPLTTNHFKCGLCYEDFENNAQLLNHLQCQHKGLSLSAQYRCGACNAKFYRNSYLVRHCWFHHTPLCLKTNGQSDDK